VDISSPVGGGKFKQVIKDIINAEKEPIRMIESRKAKEQERLKLVQEFVAKVRKLPEVYKELESFKKFRELKTDLPVAAKDLVDVNIDKDKAETGEYQLEVTQLAGRHSMMSDGYESPDDEIGVGYFSYELPDGETKSVWVGPGNATLKGLVAAINGEKGLGVQASLVNDGSDGDRPWRVIVHAKKSGVNNDLAYPDFYFLDGDFRLYVDEERAAQNAIVKFNGFEIMSQSNKLDLLPGVTIDLKQAKEGYEFTLNITEDIAKIASKVKALVDAINGTLEFVNKQNKIDASSDTSRTLGGDTALVTIESRVRRLVFQNFSVDPDDEDAMMRLSDVGISFEKTGLLTFNEDKFKKTLNSNFDRIAEFFTGENNFIDQMKFITDGFLRPETGAVTTREKGIRDRIKAMDEDIGRKEANLQKREAQLKRQFSQLEGLMSSMNQQQAYMQQALGNPGVLPGIG
jgi:flagellar hook-associated protein 2